MGGGNRHFPGNEQDDHAFLVDVGYERTRNNRRGTSSFGEILGQIGLVLVVALGGALAVNVLVLALRLG